MKPLPAGVIGTRQHAFTVFLKRLPWPVCKHCGLVLLKNEETRKRQKQGCYIWKDEQ